MKALSILLVAAVFGCSTTPSEPSSSEPTVFRLERNCALCVSGTNYTVDIHADGFVLFRWNEEIEPKEHRYFISKLTVDSLARAFVSSGIHDFNASYHEKFDSATGQWYSYSDGPAHELCFNYDSQIKTISGITFPPETLRQLLDAIDIAANTDQWK